MFPIFKKTLCDVINREMSRDTSEDFLVLKEVKQFNRVSTFINREKRFLEIFAGGLLRINNQALSCLRSRI